MASISVRIYKTRTMYRVRIRLYKIPPLDLTFSSEEEAKSWLEEHEQCYHSNPYLYLRWIARNRRSLKQKGIFHVHIPLASVFSKDSHAVGSSGPC